MMLKYDILYISPDNYYLYNVSLVFKHVLYIIIIIALL